MKTPGHTNNSQSQFLLFLWCLCFPLTTGLQPLPDYSSLRPSWASMTLDSNSRVWDFPLTRLCGSLTPARCPTLQLNSGSMELEIVWDPIGKGLVLVPPACQPQCQARAPGVTCASDRLPIDWRFQQIPPCT